jgi:zinc protease
MLNFKKKHLGRPVLLALVLTIAVACDGQGTATGEGAAKTIDPSSRGEAQSLSGTIDVKRVVSPGGIEAWLVEEHAIPLVAMNFGFNGGAYSDPLGKAGLANMVSGLLDEGAGDYDSQAFQSALDENSISLSFSAGRDAFTGNLFTLSKTKELAFELQRLALTEPRFDDEPVSRIRAQIAVMQKRAASSPRSIAADLLAKQIFGTQRYARKVIGTPETLAEFSVDDMQGYRRSVLTRDRLMVAVVGDVTPEELATLLDQIFGGLPETGAPFELDPATVSADGGLTIEPFESPQSTVQFSGPGIRQDHPDFFPAYVANHILGSGGFGSRLMSEVRAKRGLTYGIYTGLQTLDRAGLFVGSVASDNARVAETIAVTKAEIDKFREDGVTQDELDDAKTYMTGAFVLGFDSNAKIARRLLAYQMQGFPLDYINIRNDKINAVTMDDVNRALAHFPPVSDISFVVVGQPEGLE